MSTSNVPFVRPTLPTDASAIQEARGAAWRQAYANLLPAEVIEQATSPGGAGGWTLPEHILASRVSFVAGFGEQVLGFASGGLARDPLTDADCELWAIYVHPKAHGQGLGRRLLEQFKSAMQAQGRTKMVLWVLKDNLPARAFYEALGGQLVPGIEKPFMWKGREVAAEVAFTWELVTSV